MCKGPCFGMSSSLPAPAGLRENRYRVERRVGEGSQGETFLATDTRDGSRVAIKRFQVRGARSWKDVELAEREAHVLSSLQHPNIPRYRDHFEHEGALYLVTDFIDGDDLAALCKRGVRFTDVEIVRFLRDAGATLGYLHDRSPPVIHRDIKPGNVVRRADGSFAFIDFGSVRHRLQPEGGSTVVGTFGYMAPEQFQGRAMPGSDVYAVAATALAILTGRAPEELPHKGLAIDVRAALASSRVSDAVQATLSAMLDPDPDKRPASIAPLLARLNSPSAAPDAWTKPLVFSEWQPPVVQDRPKNRAERRAERRVRKAARRAMRTAGFPRVFALLMVTAVLVGVSVALRAIVPLLLRMLSIVFGPSLRTAAANVERAGETAGYALERALAALAGGPTAGPGVHERSPLPPTGVRAEGTVPVNHGEQEPDARDRGGASTLHHGS